MRLWRLVIVLLLSPSLWAQYVSVSATVVDSNGSLYANCTGSAVFVGQNTTPGAGPYLLSGSVFQTQQPLHCNSSGLFTATLADNNVISPTPSQWRFNICSTSGYTGGPFCFNALVTITGTSQSITSNLTSAAPILPPIGGSGTPGGTVGQQQEKNSAGGFTGTSPIDVAQVTGSGANDIGDKCNTAYASCPSTGCHLRIPAGSYSQSTAINFATNNKAVWLDCDPGASGTAAVTQLTYTGSGVGINFQNGTATGNAITGCGLVGPASGGSTIGLLVGGCPSGQSACSVSSGSAVGETFSGLDITGFGYGIMVGNNAYIDGLQNSRIHGNGTNLIAPSTATQSGENFNITNTTFQGGGAGFSTTCFNIAANFETMTLTGDSWDQCGITLNSTGINTIFNGGNLENSQGTTTSDFLTIGSSCGQCATTLNGTNIQEDSNGAGRTHFITNGALGSTLTINGGKFTFGAEAPIAALVNGVSGSSTAITNPFYNISPTADQSGAGVATVLKAGQVNTSIWFSSNGGVFEAGAGVPSGSCPGAVAEFLRTDAPDVSHLLYLCTGGVWTAVGAP